MSLTAAITKEYGGCSGDELTTAANILEKWGASKEQAATILRIPKSSFYKYLKSPETTKLDDDQLRRISYLLNIHASLRIIFENPENVYGFMTKPNHNAYFNGQAPLSLIEKGDFGALYEVHKRVDSLRGGGW